MVGEGVVRKRRETPSHGSTMVRCNNAVGSVIVSPADLVEVLLDAERS